MSGAWLALGGTAAVIAVLMAVVVAGIGADRMSWLMIAAVAAVSGITAGLTFHIHRARDAMRRRLHLLDHLGETGATPRIVVDRDGRFVWANAHFREAFDADEATSLDDLERQVCRTDEDRARFRRAWDSGRAGTPVSIEQTVAAPHGLGNEVYRIVVFPVAGMPGETSWLIQDLTAQREMEKVIRDEQAKLIDFLDNAPVGFYSVDSSGRFLFVNNTLAQWLGLAPEDLMRGDRRLHDFVAAELTAETPPFDPFGSPGAASASGAQTGEVTLRSVHGRTFQAAIAQGIAAGDDGQLRTRSVVRDLTPEQAMARALRQSEQRFQGFFEEAPVGIVLLDGDGRVTECSRTFRRMVGMADREAVGRRLTDLVLPEDRAGVEAHLAGAAESGETGAPIEVRLPGQPDIIASLYVRRLERSTADGPELILHFLDITDQKRLETQVAQSQKMQAVGQLAGGIAHDFNNLLTAMIGFCDLLLLRHQMGDPSFADIMQIRQNANRAANLVRQLLAFSRQQRLQPKVLNVTDALAELYHLLRRLIGENIELKMVHGRDLHLVKVDQGQFEQVIINLAVNARDAMVEGGQLLIRTANMALAAAERRGLELMPAGDYILIEVKDSGTGIPKEHIGRIFEPFFSTKEVGSGTGLGLSTVYGIVKQTGGFIFVDSERGEGATFSIYLPRWRGEVGKAAESAASPADPKRDLTGVGTVLLVEDEDAVRLFSARALRNKGYKVVEAKSGESALKLLREHGGKIDLLVTDVVMPEMDGASLIRIVREQRPDMKVICISGYAEEAFRKRLDNTDDIHFLPKPFSLDQLAGKVKEVMRAGA